MSDFVSQNMLPDLWEDILQRHWTYLETEESMLKLDERKKLEGCLKQFLCLVPHDRKFFLPETSYVLKKSIEEMTEFSAYNAMIGFESISQYANNLFTKPWRKEYKVIKMYSGFYQHEIKSKLLYAEKLFEAMGYRQFNQLLILDGPICPDQVTNVSRDAMAAYVECQIMKQILSGLTSMQLSCNWLDIFKFRETHISGQSQAIKMMAHVLQEKRFRKEKLNQENCYGNKYQHIIQQQNCYANCNSNLCHFQPQSTSNQPISMQSINSCQLHNSTQQPPTVVHKYPQHSCSLHNKQLQQSAQSSIYNNSQLNFPNYPHMSHSKSLEHYNDSVANNMIPQRHSFDHYEPTFDCVDAGCNFNAYNHHPYNVSGNRYPLPYNISNQLMYGQGYHHQQSVPSPPSVLHSNLGNFSQNGHLNKVDATSVYGYQQHTPQHFNAVNGPTRPIKSLSHDSSCNMHTHDEYAPSQIHRRSITSGTSTLQNDPLIQLSNQVKDNLYIDTDDPDGNYIYSKPRQTQSNLAKKISVDLQKLHSDNTDACKLMKQNSSSATGSVSSKSSKSATNKNQDGVGSFESWNFVFQNLEKHGYSKDLGERGDLFIQGVDSKINDTSNGAGHSPYEDEGHIIPHQHLSRKNRDSLSANVNVSQNAKHKEKQDTKNNQNHSNIATSNNRDSSSNRTKSHKAKVVKNSVNNNVENYIDNVITSGSNCKVTSGEWSCRFCTFLNPDSKRICEMCSRSKDCNLDTTKSSTATCV